MTTDAERDEAFIASQQAAHPMLMGGDYSTYISGRFERFPGLRRPMKRVSAEAQRARLLADLDLEAAMAQHIDATAPRRVRPEPREWDHE